MKDRQVLQGTMFEAISGQLKKADTRLDHRNCRLYEIEANTLVNKVKKRV